MRQGHIGRDNKAVACVCHVLQLYAGKENGSLAQYECVLGGGFFFSSRRRHTRSDRDWSSDVCSSDLFLLMFGQIHTAALQYGFAAAAIRASWFWSLVVIVLAVVGFVAQWRTMQEYTLERSEGASCRERV